MTGIFDDLPTLFDLPALHLDAGEIERLILVHGNCGELRRGIVCPCMRLETRQGNSNCPVCLGVGHTYPPSKRVPMIFLDHSRTSSIRHNGPGHLADGQIRVTLPADAVPAKGDLLIPTGDIAVVQEVFHRDVAQVTNALLTSRRLMPDQLPMRLGARAARLLYSDVLELESLWWIQDGRLVEAQRGPEYQLVDGEIRWTASGPAAGEGFTVRYRAPQAYIIFGNAPLFRHEANRRMPWSVIANRLDKLQRDADLR